MIARPRLDRLPRERVAELLRDDLDARGRGRSGDHRTSAGRENERGVRDHERRVDAEPLLEQRRIDAAEVGGRLHVAVLVEAVLQAGELADHLPVRARADQEADAGRAVVGARVAVLLGAPAELRPDVHEHAVGEAARLEVALEREQRVRRQSAGPAASAPGLVECVS